MPGQGEKGQDSRLFGLWIGTVVSNQDPSRLGRIRWKVPGLVEKSPWALPVGLSAQKDEGTWNIPSPGENVLCALLGGDPTKPIWIAGPWGEGEVPFDSVEKKGLRFFDFQLQVEETAAVLEDLQTGLKVELDRTTQNVSVHGNASVRISSLGTVEIEAVGCTILGRPVKPVGGPI